MNHKRVLIVEDDEAFATVLALRCRQLGLMTRTAGTATCALQMLTEEMPDLILLDMGIPCEIGGTTNRHGMVFCETLPRSVFSDVPVIVISGSDDLETRSCCQLAGALYVSKGPGAWDVLKPAIIKLLELEPQAKPAPAPRAYPQLTDDKHPAPLGPKILCVDDDPDINLAIGMRLRQFGGLSHPRVQRCSGISYCTTRETRSGAD